MKKFIAGKFERYDNADGIDGGIYLKDADGNDWYQYREQYKDKGVAAAFDDAGLIKGFNTDITYIFPDNQFFTLIDPADVPAEMQFDGKSAYQGFWVFDTKTMAIVPYQPPHDQLVADAEQKKQQLLSEAASKILILQNVCNPTINPKVTPDQQAQLLAWEKYQVALYLIDPNLAPDID